MTGTEYENITNELIKDKIEVTQTPKIKMSSFNENVSSSLREFNKNPCMSWL